MREVGFPGTCGEQGGVIWVAHEIRTHFYMSLDQCPERGTEYEAGMMILKSAIADRS
jgi:hypothetical protein